eukprot:5198987-Alexandrium_andersonii.AAC.1
MRPWPLSAWLSVLPLALSARSEPRAEHGPSITVPCALPGLVFGGESLDDSKAFGDYGVTEGATLQVRAP